MNDRKANELAKAAQALLDAVTFDDCGALIAGKYQGGNGGMISRETTRKADALRRVLHGVNAATQEAGQ